MHNIEPKYQFVIDKINKLIRGLKKRNVSVKNISDGYHTFEELYYHRMFLFSIICNNNKDIAWKSLKHNSQDETPMFSNDLFIVGINTPEGTYSYHYKKKFWDYFQVQELEEAPMYDGHMPEDITRLSSLIK